MCDCKALIQQDQVYAALLSADESAVLLAATSCHMKAVSLKSNQHSPILHLSVPAQYKQAILFMSGVCGVCSVDDMVVAAVISLQDPVGSGPDDICAWIEVETSLFTSAA